LSRRTNVILWTGIAAAATGIAAVVAIVKWNEQTETEATVTKGLRNIQDVLADCKRKITEIEQHLPDMSRDSLPPRSTPSSNGAHTV
jgi:hypothetical protein